MPALTVKNIPDELYDHLKVSAQVHRRSLNSEMIHCLETALMPRRVSTQTMLADARALRQQVKVQKVTAAEINAARNAGRK